jgi:alpha-ketoglutarate-dependent taurine dioxygenase
MQIENLTEAFGARVTGLDLTHDFDDATRATLRQALQERGALVFSGLDIETLDQDRLCRMLCGDDEREAGKRDPQYVSNTEKGGSAPYGRLLYHADMMWHPKPFEVLSLYGKQAESGAATTSLASGVVAWERLPADLKARVEKLEALQVTGTVNSRGGDDLLKSDREKEYSCVKPIKITHPRTGKPILYVSQQTTREIVGMEHGESEALLLELFSHLYAPDVVYEHTWHEGDMLVFDNIALQHARSNVELNGPKRTLRKVIAPVPKLNMETPTFEKTREAAM